MQCNVILSAVYNYHVILQVTSLLVQLALDLVHLLVMQLVLTLPLHCMWAGLLIMQ